MSQPTICVRCRNYCTEKTGTQEVIWYDQYCGASRRPQEPDFVNGLFIDTMELGPMKNCRDVNRYGKCQLFQPIPCFKDLYQDADLGAELKSELKEAITVRELAEQLLDPVVGDFDLDGMSEMAT